MRNPLLLILAVVAGSILLFGGSLTGGQFVVDPTGAGDVYHLSLIYERAAHHLAAGSFPFYFPEFACGYPVAATWMYGLYYPGAAVFSILPPDAAWSVSAALHLLLAAGGMYLFVRRMLGDRNAAATAAVVYAFSEFMIGRIVGGHLNLVWPMAWVPWTLWAAGRCARSERGGFTLLGLTLGLGLVSGHIQIWFYVAPFLALYALLETSSASSRPRAIASLAAAVLIAVGISSVQWISTYEFVAATGRPGTPSGLQREFASPLYVIASKVFPGFLGHLPVRGEGGTWWPGGEFAHEGVAIGGLGLIFLALLGLFGRQRGKWVWFAAAVTGIVLAPGIRTSISSWVSSVPPFSWSRVSSRSLLLAVLGGSVLIAHGVRAWRAGEVRGRRLRRVIIFTAAAAVGALGALGLWMDRVGVPNNVEGTCVAAVLKSLAGLAAVVFGLYLVRWRPRFAPLFPVLIFGVVLATALPPVETQSSEFYFRDWSSSFPDDARESRIYVQGSRFPIIERRGLRGVRAVSPADVPWFMDMIRHGSVRHRFWLDIDLGVDRLRRDEIFGGPPWAQVRILGGGPVCGRAMLFERAEVVPDDHEAMRRLDAGRLELLLAEPAELPAYVGPIRGEVRSPERVEHMPDPDPNRVRFEVTASRPRWLYVSEKYYPVWRATVDGEEVACVRANVFGIAIPVPAGEHRVAIEFDTAARTIGMPITFISLILALASLIPALSRTRLPSPGRKAAT